MRRNSGGMRHRRGVLPIVLAALLATACGPGVFSHGGNDGRTALYADEAGLNSQLVGGGTFGQMFSSAVDGQVYAQPVIAKGTALVVTEKNKVLWRSIWKRCCPGRRSW